MKRIVPCLIAVLLLSNTTLAAGYRIAVTDLTYEERVSHCFRNIEASQKSSTKASNRYRERDSDFSSSASGSNRLDARSESKFSLSEGTLTYLYQGELHKFTADIKGEMLKSGLYQVVQGTPYPINSKDQIYDIIARIEKGMYRGADYVLFGTVSNMEWRDETNPVQGTDKATKTLSLELVCDFSLIETKTRAIKAAFSAMGQGQDVKFVTGANSVIMNRGKVVSEVSKSLGADVARQLEEQFIPVGKGKTGVTMNTGSPQKGPQIVEKTEEVIILR